MRLQDKVAIVTGAAGGIGRACAERFVSEGARVVVADIDEAKGRNTVEEINAVQGGQVAAFAACDVGDKASVDGLIAGTVEHFGRLDICVANAGIVHVADYLDVTEADFDRVLRVNLKGVFLTGQAAARQMVAQGDGGAIINMSSVNAVMAIPGITSYEVSKGGVNQLTKVMAISLASHNIRVNAVGPGSIMTEVLQAVAADKAAMQKILSRTPLGRVGEVDEVAAVALFLASDDASYVTGQTVYPDGGRMALNYTVPVVE